MTAPIAAARCIAEPVSWPRLERFAVGELDAAAAAAIRAHLDACAVCRSCLDRLRDDVVPLPALPAISPPPRSPWAWLRWAPAGALVAAAAIALLLLRVRVPDEPLAWPAPAGMPAIAPRVAIKGGGTLSLGLVRERTGIISLSPTTFADGDRFKARITCDRPVAWIDVVVYDPAGASFPLPPTTIACGNDVTLPGAFRLTGSRNLVCVALADAPPDRRALAAPSSDLACRSLRRE